MQGMTQSLFSTAQAASSFAGAPQLRFVDATGAPVRHVQPEPQEDIESVIARLQKKMAAAETAKEMVDAAPAERPDPTPEAKVTAPDAEAVPNIFAYEMVLPAKAEPDFAPEADTAQPKAPIGSTFGPSRQTTAELTVGGGAKSFVETEFAEVPATSAKMQAEGQDTAVDPAAEIYKESFCTPDHFDFG